MGNTNTSPSHKSRQSFAVFLQTCNENLMRNRGNFKEHSRLFSIFLEDFIQNDEEYLKFDEKDRKLCLASMIYLFKSSPIDSNDLNFAKPGFTIVDGFCKGVSGAHIIQKALKAKYVRDGSDFYEWNDELKTMTKCSDDLNCDEFVTHVHHSVDSKFLDFSTETIVDAVADLNKFLGEVHSVAEVFVAASDKEEYLVKVKTKKFSLESHIIPCCSGPFNITNGTLCKTSKGNYVAERLPYDPDQNTTPLVTGFVGKFKCSTESLATHLIRCGVDVDRTLTIICGPENSGKRTLVRVTKALYDSVEALKARTCYVDESFLSDRSKSDDHPCAHLVVICGDNDVLRSTGGVFDKTSSARSTGSIGDTFGELNDGNIFGNRILRKVSLAKPIKPDNRVEDISTKLNTNSELGALLGWAYKKCDLSKLGMKSSGDHDFTSMSGFMRSHMRVSGNNDACTGGLSLSSLLSMRNGELSLPLPSMRADELSLPSLLSGMGELRNRLERLNSVIDNS